MRQGLKNTQLSYVELHSILLSMYNHITELIICDCHLKNHHADIQITLYLSCLKNQVRKVIRSCVKRFRTFLEMTKYKMGDLPSIRIQRLGIFSKVRMDYCSIFLVKKKISEYKNDKSFYRSSFVWLQRLCT